MTRRLECDDAGQCDGCHEKLWRFAIGAKVACARAVQAGEEGVYTLRGCSLTIENVFSVVLKGLPMREGMRICHVTHHLSNVTNFTCHQTSHHTQTRPALATHLCASLPWRCRCNFIACVANCPKSAAGFSSLPASPASPSSSSSSSSSSPCDL